MKNARIRAHLASLLALSALWTGGCGSDEGSGNGGATTADAKGSDTSSDASSCTDGATCTPADLCATAGACKDGSCVASGQKDCDDGLACTADSCDPTTGTCKHAVAADACVIDAACLPEGATRTDHPCEHCVPSSSQDAWTLSAGPCDDGDPCTTADSCDPSSGACNGKAKDCDDGKECNTDSCDAKTGDCIHPFANGTCDDGDPCTGDGQCSSGDCFAGLDKDCGDGDACTKDTCASDTGACSSAPDPNACDDGNSCTTDSCDSKAGCSHVALPVGATCSDGDACTHGEACASNGCTGGELAVCDDSNPCTADSCNPKLGCVNAFLDITCNDGQSCTTGDKCSGGFCLGQKTLSCPACNKTFGATSAQMTGFVVGIDGNPGHGLDVDGDPSTCAPKKKCSAGIDNSFAELAPILNPVLATAMKSGSLRFVADFAGFAGQNKSFAINLYYALLSPSSEAKSCDPLLEPCGWLVSQQAFTAACTPRVSFTDAKLVGDKLTAGGPGTIFAMEVSLAGGDATFLVKGARLEGTLVLAADGKTVSSFTGVIAGSMTEKAVLSTFAGFPEDAFAPLSKSGVLALIKSLLVLDVDADGDGTPESVSVGLEVKALGATLEGMAK